MFVALFRPMPQFLNVTSFIRNPAYHDGIQFIATIVPHPLYPCNAYLYTSPPLTSSINALTCL
jgi:hypothetical protein